LAYKLNRINTEMTSTRYLTVITRSETSTCYQNNAPSFGNTISSQKNKLRLVGGFILHNCFTPEYSIISQPRASVEKLSGVGAMEKRPKNSTINSLSTIFVPYMKIQGGRCRRSWSQPFWSFYKGLFIKDVRIPKSGEGGLFISKQRHILVKIIILLSRKKGCFQFGPKLFWKHSWNLMKNVVSARITG